VVVKFNHSMQHAVVADDDIRPHILCCSHDRTPNP